jgi:iron complex transport system substrate-binding protein
MRICSLLPSATEIVYALGLGDQLVGVTHICDYPEAASSLPVLTTSLRVEERPGLAPVHKVSVEGIADNAIFSLDSALLRELAPQLILTQDICEVCVIGSATVQAVATAALEHTPEFLTIHAMDVEGTLQSILDVGVAAGVAERAETYVASLRERVDAVKATVAEHAPRAPRVLCLEWGRPLWAGGLWMSDMVGIAGGVHGLVRAGEHSYPTSWEEVVAFQPEMVLFMPCGYDMESTRQELALLVDSPEWGKLPAVQSGQIYVFDGRVPSRHGPRLVDVLEAFAEIIHPSLFPAKWQGALYEQSA